RLKKGSSANDSVTSNKNTIGQDTGPNFYFPKLDTKIDIQNSLYLKSEHGLVKLKDGTVQVVEKCKNSIKNKNTNNSHILESYEINMNAHKKRVSKAEKQKVIHVDVYLKLLLPLPLS